MKTLSRQRRSLEAGKPRVERPALPYPVLMLVTESMDREWLYGIVKEAVRGGVNMVQLRDKSAPALELTTTAAILKLVLNDVPLVVNGSPGVARGTSAAGAHLPEETRNIDGARGALGPAGLIGYSVHSRESARKAEANGADYLIAGTIFASNSHPGQEPAGLEFLEAVCAAVRIPVIAIGGITPENAADCMGAGAAGVAVLSPIMRADDPRAVAARYWEVLERCSS